MIPVFLDVEASSLSPMSYPIEIAWSDEKGNIESHLINPYSYPEHYDDWDPSAQAVHKLSRNYLSEHGEHFIHVAKTMERQLSGKIVYTDAPYYDQFWCDQLFEITDILYTFNFRDINELLQNMLPIEYFYMNMTTNIAQIDYLKEQARVNCQLEAHRAANDVTYLIELYKLASNIVE